MHCSIMYFLWKQKVDQVKLLLPNQLSFTSRICGGDNMIDHLNVILMGCFFYLPHMYSDKEKKGGGVRGKRGDLILIRL